MTRDWPRPPAAAYGQMARLLGAAYFLSHPPNSGVRITAVGHDGVPTHWDVAESVAAAVVKKARRRSLVVSTTTYMAPPKRTT